MDTFYITVLILSGLALTYAGLIRLLKPENTLFLKNHKGQITTDIRNETKSVGAVLLAAAITAFVGVASTDARTAALTTTTVVLLGVALGRAISMVTDGKPNEEILKRSFSAELLLGVANAISLLAYIV